MSAASTESGCGVGAKFAAVEAGAGVAGAVATEGGPAARSSSAAFARRARFCSNDFAKPSSCAMASQASPSPPLQRFSRSST